MIAKLEKPRWWARQGSHLQPDRYERRDIDRFR